MMVIAASTTHHLLYSLRTPTMDGRTELILTPLELLDRLAHLVTPPRIHKHRYYGVLAPNAKLRRAVARCWAVRLAAGGRAVSAFNVLCMRSWRPRPELRAPPTPAAPAPWPPPGLPQWRPRAAHA